jgi:regulator of sigma E protease
MLTLFNIFLMILGFGLLIFVHELGHFLAAKWADIRTEAFAVGMGPVIVAWRKGVGFSSGSTRAKVLLATGKNPEDLSDEELEKHQIGETEYSLRWLPIGGFVKMLGQEDANPAAVSDAPRSYNRCPVGKRMIVVSAGVVMNVLLAAVLFLIAFMVGVRFEAPVIGHVSSTHPAGVTVAENARALGIATAGLQPGDRVLSIDGREARTFSDIQIAAAMGRPDVPFTMEIERAGYDEPLRFTMTPEHDPAQGLLSIGVMPAFSTHLQSRDRGGNVKRILDDSGLTAQGVKPGMILTHVSGEPIDTFEQLDQIVQQSGGEPIETTWRMADRSGRPTGDPVTAMLPVDPTLQPLRYVDAPPEAATNFEHGLFGMVPLTGVVSVDRKSANYGILRPGDAVLRLGDEFAPRWRTLLESVRSQSPGTLPITVVRDGEEVEVSAKVVRRGFLDAAGMLQVVVGPVLNTPYMAAPMESVAVYDADEQRLKPRPTPVAAIDLFEGTRIDEVNGTPIADWRELRAMLIDYTRSAYEEQSGASINVTVTHPTPGREREVVTLVLEPVHVSALHQLGWRIDLPSIIFEPIYTTRTAGGNPITALAMGVEETHKFLVLTYLTIDRLFRRTVGVDQLRGPVGIVHLGTLIADRGILYLIFLLAVISVNLAVINFLPLPIVDGGLFLFLVYEKIKGKPPSIAFQNAVTILGLFLIGTIFIVVTYHDIVRLIT